MYFNSFAQTGLLQVEDQKNTWGQSCAAVAIIVTDLSVRVSFCLISYLLGGHIYPNSHISLKMCGFVNCLWFLLFAANSHTVHFNLCEKFMCIFFHHLFHLGMLEMLLELEFNFNLFFVVFRGVGSFWWPKGILSAMWVFENKSLRVWFVIKIVPNNF
jgi:hypothetical protein